MLKLETIGRRINGKHLMTRLIVGDRSKPHPRLHVMHRGDADSDCHDHPADFWTFPLTSYVEQVYTPGPMGGMSFRLVRAFRLHKRKAEYAHRIWGRWAGRGLAVKPGRIVTLIWWGAKRREWGFHVPGRGWVPWREYV